jgi:hypothetical protein
MPLFAEGQKRRMRTLLAAGGLRGFLSNSPGLKLPLIAEMPLAEQDPTWLEPEFFPNPATSYVQIDLSYDRRWMGQSYRTIDLQGRVRMQGAITSVIHQFELKGLNKGCYLLEARRTDGVVYKTKFLKQ